MANYNRSSLVLSVNRALWGEVMPNLRQVTTTIAHGAVRVRFVFHGTLSGQDREMTARVTHQVSHDFPELKPHEECLAGDGPLVVEDGWNQVYRRKE